MKTRICTQCHTRKPATVKYFGRQTAAKDGLHTHCRICRQKANREAIRARRLAEHLAMIDEEESATPDSVIERQPTAHGTIVHFGKAWRPAHPSPRIPALIGYSSGLARL